MTLTSQAIALTNPIMTTMALESDSDEEEILEQGGGQGGSPAPAPPSLPSPGDLSHITAIFQVSTTLE